MVYQNMIISYNNIYEFMTLRKFKIVLFTIGIIIIILVFSIFYLLTIKYSYSLVITH